MTSSKVCDAVDHFARVDLLNGAANQAHDGRRIARGAQNDSDAIGDQRASSFSGSCMKG